VLDISLSQYRYGFFKKEQRLLFSVRSNPKRGDFL
jgi:hypothetical protein